MDLASPYVEAHAVERAGAGEGLADAADAEDKIAVAGGDGGTAPRGEDTSGMFKESLPRACYFRTPHAFL